MGIGLAGGVTVCIGVDGVDDAGWDAGAGGGVAAGVTGIDGAVAGTVAAGVVAAGWDAVCEVWAVPLEAQLLKASVTNIRLIKRKQAPRIHAVLVAGLLFMLFRLYIVVTPLFSIDNRIFHFPSLIYLIIYYLLAIFTALQTQILHLCSSTMVPERDCHSYGCRQVDGRPEDIARQKRERPCVLTRRAFLLLDTWIIYTNPVY